jgi:hypothetical protein
MDETTNRVLKELGRKAQSKSYLWVRRGGPHDHPIVLYHFDPSRNWANGVEPNGYLRHVFTELPKATNLEDVEALLPHRMV